MCVFTDQTQVAVVPSTPSLNDIDQQTYKHDPYLPQPVSSDHTATTTTTNTTTIPTTATDVTTFYLPQPVSSDHHTATTTTDTTTIPTTATYVTTTETVAIYNMS